MKRGILSLVLVLVLMGCNPASKAVKWAERADAERWQAEYKIIFHQMDEDIQMSVREVNGETLTLDITMPSGSLRLEYGGGLLINLDQGGLEWEDQFQQPPYYALSELSRLVVSVSQLERDGDWAVIDGYRLRLEDGLPVEIMYESEWTMYIETFSWN